MLINWQEVSQHIEKVVFSSLDTEEAYDELDLDIAHLKLKNHYGIDIGWYNRNATFEVRLFQNDNYHNMVKQVDLDSVDAVVEWVKEQAELVALGAPK